jgi:hypothetical protein
VRVDKEILSTYRDGLITRPACRIHNSPMLGPMFQVITTQPWPGNVASMTMGGLAYLYQQNGPVPPTLRELTGAPLSW